MMTTTVDRLRDGRRIAAVLRARRQRAGQLLVVHALADDRPGSARVAVVASRRVGGAVPRNRAKRLLREAARMLAWRDGADVVLIARAACAGSSLAAVRTELERLARELGVVVDEA